MSEEPRTDGGMAARRGGSTDEPSTDTRTPKERARDAVSEFVDEHVQETRYANASLIAKQVSVDARAQNISRVISEKITGDAPDGFVEDMRVGRWSEGSPITWYFERVAGDPAPDRLIDRKRKVDIVIEISEAIGADGAETYVANSGHESTKISMPNRWLHDVLAAVCEEVGYDPELGDEDEEDDRDLREQIGDLGRDECSAVLEKAVESIEVTGTTDHWNKETCARIHEVLIDGGDDSGD